VVGPEHRAGVGADGEERGVTERDLPGVAGDDVQPRRADRRDHDERRDRQLRRAEHERQHDGGDGERRQREPGRHRRSAGARPNSP